MLPLFPLGASKWGSVKGIIIRKIQGFCWTLSPNLICAQAPLAKLLLLLSFKIKIQKHVNEMMLEKPAGKPNARCTCLTMLRMVYNERPNCKRNFFKLWFSLNLHRYRHLLFPLHRYTHLLFALHRYRHLLFDIASRSMPSKIFPFPFLLKKVSK